MDQREQSRVGGDEPRQSSASTRTNADRLNSPFDEFLFCVLRSLFVDCDCWYRVFPFLSFLFFVFFFFLFSSSFGRVEYSNESWEESSVGRGASELKIMAAKIETTKKEKGSQPNAKA